MLRPGVVPGPRARVRPRMRLRLRPEGPASTARRRAPSTAAGVLATMGAVALALALASCGSHSSDAPPAGPGHRRPSGLHVLARDVRANASLRVDPCHAATRTQLRLLGLPTRPSIRSVDFVATRCRWSGHASSLEVAISATSGLAIPTDAARTVAVRSARRAVVVERSVLRDPASAKGQWVRAVVARRHGRRVAVELTRAHPAPLAAAILPAIAEVAISSR